MAAVTTLGRVLDNSCACAVAPRFAVTLGRLHALRRLTLRFASVRDAEVVRTVGGLLLG